ncbi:MAG: hypothetical protein FJ198_00650 [Gammaproteobacteria bacterium]|nr:hypothetical protein [Gammaproteobacteria bacterium]
MSANNRAYFLIAVMASVAFGAGLTVAAPAQTAAAVPEPVPVPAAGAAPAADATPAPITPAAIAVSFIDLQAFHDDLNAQLGKAGEQAVEVEFYSAVSPNQIPPRVERRLAAVRKEGGRIGVVQPQANSSTRSIGAAIGLFSGLWNFMKTFEAAATERAMVRSVKDRDADIVLGRDEQGAVFIRKIVFKKRPPAETSTPKQG